MIFIINKYFVVLLLNILDQVKLTTKNEFTTL